MSGNNSSSPSGRVLVKIEFLRIQTFLFAIPRLKPMLGANALLGQVIRHELPKLMDTRVHGSKLEFSETLAADLPKDPLEAASVQLCDDPAALYRCGILSRDGGHFHAVFDDAGQAERFRECAATCIAEFLPGLRFEISRQCLDSGKTLDEPRVLSPSIADLPHFRICEETGTEPASRLKKDGDQERAFSRKANALIKAGEDFQKKAKNEHGLPGYDIVSLLRNQLPGYEALKHPEDLEKLAGRSGYIAVIHADGNGIGARRKHWAGEVDKAERIKHEARNEVFFHAMRRVVRASVVQALKAVFTQEALSDMEHLPYQVLMLGGDDLVMVCQARFALDFVRHYADQLRQYPIPWEKEDKTRPISIGAGVVIARYNIPFHRLHALAEQLAGSAKRLYRLQPLDEQQAIPERSVVDWLVTTATWVDPPEAGRQRHQLVRYQVGETTEETLALTGKPYFVLPDSENTTPALSTLAGLLDAGEKLLAIRNSAREQGKTDRETLARSQLKDLAEALHQGRSYAQMCFRNLPEGMRAKLKEPDHGGLTPETLFFHEDTFPENRYLTRFLDLLEIMEIHELGRKDK